jgi:hypothetical protein
MHNVLWSFPGIGSRGKKIGKKVVLGTQSSLTCIKKMCSQFCTVSELSDGNAFVSWGLPAGYSVKKETFFSSQGLLWGKESCYRNQMLKMHACSKLLLS